MTLLTNGEHAISSYRETTRYRSAMSHEGARADWRAFEPEPFKKARPFGLAYVPDEQTREHIGHKRLISVLDDWCPRLSGYHLYYPNRKPPAAFALVVEALRYKG